MLDYSKKKIEKCIEEIESSLIQLFIDAVNKNDKDVVDFLEKFRSIVDSFVDNISPYGLDGYRKYKGFLDRYGYVWYSLFIQEYPLSFENKEGLVNSYFSELTKDMVHLFDGYDPQKFKKHYLSGNPFEVYDYLYLEGNEANYYLEFINNNRSINENLERAYKKRFAIENEYKLNTSQTKLEIRNHFEPELLKWFDKDDVEYFFRSNFQCFKGSEPRKLLSSKNENDYGLQSRLYKLTYSFYEKEEGKGENKIRYAEMLKNNFKVFEGSTLRTIEKALRKTNN